MAVRIHTAVKNADDYHGGFRFAIEDHMPLDRVRPQSSGDGIAQRAHAGVSRSALKASLKWPR